uniref:ATP-dependent RNA helicase SUPV3L1, mitochondrial n=1 Tax=Naja naja TaxID=35670 RepID=A0A8C6VTQ8_NAJNA
MSVTGCARLLSRLPSGQFRCGCPLALRSRGGGLSRASSLPATARIAFFASSNGDEDSGVKSPDTSLFVPLQVSPQTFAPEVDVGAELTSPLNKSEVLKTLNKFCKRREIQKLAAENGLDARLFHQVFVSFRKYIIESSFLNPDLHIILNDICCGAGHVDDLFPFFLQHARQIFPMLECMDDLRKISDLRLPPNWYPEARAVERKIRYLKAESGVYCGPLKLLAHEIFQKSNDDNVACDLITGEERVCIDPEGRAAAHVACTIEMCSVNTPYDVAVIDEIQMIKDPSRGWAWTRALLGLCAKEIHVCGEEAAINLVTELMFTTGEEVEVKRYKRLTPIKILNKNDIYSVSRQIEFRGLECAVIYGSLPPGTKLTQAKKFNDPDDPCKIMVATDAIGMGLNLSIKRIIFNSLIKPQINEKGEKEMNTITTSQALQISGRAGRFSSMFKEGEVTTMHGDDLILLKKILSEPVDPIEAAGLHPTAEQIEMFAYHLPGATLSNLIDIFVSLSQVDGLYFVCNIDNFKFLAKMIQHIPLHLRARYVFCTAPINQKEPFVCTSLLKFARQFSRNEPVMFDWLCRHINWPLVPPKNIKDLVHLEAVHDVLDLYLWLSYRFMDMFPDAGHVRAIQKKLDDIIQIGVLNITRLIQASQVTSEAMGIPIESLRIDNRFPQAEMTEISTNKEMVPSPRRARGPKARSLQSADGQLDPLAQMKGPLTERLIQQGLLSKEVLKQLEKEWLAQQDKSAFLKSSTIIFGGGILLREKS